MYTFSVNPEKWSFMLVWAGYFQWVGIKCVLFHFVFLLWEPKIIAYMFSWFSRQDNHKVYINQHHDHLRLHKLPTFLPSTHLLTHPRIPFLMQPNVAFFYSGIIAIKNCGQFHKGCKKKKKSTLACILSCLQPWEILMAELCHFMSFFVHSSCYKKCNSQSSHEIYTK